MQNQEKVRVYTLARRLNVETKELLAFCGAQGWDVKNQLSPLTQEQVARVK